MQQQQQQQAGNPLYESPSYAVFVAASNNSDLGIPEEASPLSSRPPATAPFDGDGGNRWPRQETLALLQIRSDMDVIFRDATLKGPLWEDVSRKLAEQGFKRSAKKCKEKFENVHKYYKRTKEGRAGRQDGKSYRFFTQLEALHNTISSTITTSTCVQPNLPNPMSNIPISSVRATTPLVTSSSQMSQQFGVFNQPVGMVGQVGQAGVTFSSDSGMESSGSDDMDGEDELDLEPDMMEGEPSNRKRKRGSSNSSGKMMEFFEGLMKQVMQKQEALQQKFLEAVEKREQDRMIREEAWKRQEVARLAREHELMVQERNVTAARDAAIISFLQKITGQTIQLPTVSPPPPPQQQPPPPPPQVSVQQPPTELFQKLPVQQPPPPQQQQQNTAGALVAVPEQQVAPLEMSGGGMEAATSSRWPKPEVLALIKIRSGLEPRYQEAGPKGPLWEEISAGMHGLGYKRNPKRCKEKWENINKYFKKVKESNKKRPEDAKTCPYFHELDALYRKKILGGSPLAIGGIGSNSQLLLQQPPEQQQQQQQQQTADHIQHIMPSVPEINVPTSNGDLTATLFGEGSDSGVGGGVAKKPEDILKEQQHENRQNLTMNDFDRLDHHSNINLDHQDQDDEYDDDDDNDDDDDDDGDEEAQESMKMAYKIQFQRSNGAGSSSNGSGSGSGNGTTSFLAMVQ